MDRAFPAALVSDFEVLFRRLICTDADDRHVLAAAVYARAEMIMTVNLNDFPAAALLPHHIDAAHPDSFVDYLFNLDVAEAINAIAGNPLLNVRARP